MALYAFDGTWNSATLDDNVEQANETNVAHFSEAYNGERLYISGPGTRFGNVGRVIGGAFGAGGPMRLKEAYKELCDNWAQGDRVIDIVGFSRGAALALDFANKVEDSGIRRPGTKDVVEERPPIRFLGLWDVVGSFGVPINVGLLDFQEVNFGHKLSIPDNVEYCFHAIAMDERRQTFRVTRVLNGYEVWFRGVHSDVGGGNGNVGLSSITLRWMLRKAVGAGLPIKDSFIPAHESKINPDAPLRPPKDLIPNEYRGFLKGDLFHYTVKSRPDCNNAPDNCAVEAEADESRAVRLGDLPARGAETGGVPLTSSRLEVGQEVGVEVEARKCWNAVGIAVKKGERYEIAATGKYTDNEHECTADGFESSNWLLRRFEGTKRVPRVPWFSLIAAVHPSRTLESEDSEASNLLTDIFAETFSRSVKKRDAESQLVSVGSRGGIEVDRDGYLYLFANDSAWAYANNSGSIKATVRRAR
jgi:hypothetical protein